MVETIVFIAVPALAFVATVVVVIRGELKAEKSREVMFEECKNLREQVLELEELTDKKYYIPQEWYAQLQTENKQLRELVQDYDRVLASTDALCDRDFAPLNDATLLALRSRMYELGIEV